MKSVFGGRGRENFQIQVQNSGSFFFFWNRHDFLLRSSLSVVWHFAGGVINKIQTAQTCFWCVVSFRAAGFG